MKKYVDGLYLDITEDEAASLVSVEISYEKRVALRVREKYSADDELALLRQRDTKPDEFAAYNAFVEAIKAEER